MIDIYLRELYGKARHAPQGPPVPTPCKESFQDVFSTNWTKSESLHSHKDFPRDISAFQFALSKPEFFPSSFNGTFKQDVSLLTMSDLHRLKQISYCRPGLSKGWRCGRHDACPYCNWLRFDRENNRLTECLSSHAGKRLYTATLSFTEPVRLDDDLDLALVLWDVLEAAVRQAHADRYFEGVFFAKELAVSSFLPVTGRPHAHLLIFARHGVNGLAESLSLILASSKAWQRLLDSGAVPANFSPDIQLELTRSPGEVRKWLFYSMKVFSVSDVYQREFERINASQRAALNQEVADVLNCYDLEMTRSHRGGTLDEPLYRASGRCMRLGRMHWHHRDKVTTPRDEWREEKHIELREEIRRQSKAAPLRDDDEEAEMMSDDSFAEEIDYFKATPGLFSLEDPHY